MTKPKEEGISAIAGAVGRNDAVCASTTRAVQ